MQLEASALASLYHYIAVCIGSSSSEVLENEDAACSASQCST